jgi:threonine dehydrogenase-like Zn-dependent dehydrogenase
MAMMKGVVLPGSCRVKIREFPVPEPGHGQVLVRMKASSLCGSDLRAIYRPQQQGTGPEAYRGVIAGHEPAGQIEQVGPGVTRFRAADRVIVYHIAGCGVCHNCRQGWMISCNSPQRAAYGWQRDGGHAPFLLAEERTLVALPDELTYLDGAMVACGFGTAYAACLRAGISGNDRVLVTGLGPVGLGAALLCRALGAEVVGTEASPQRREIAANLGIQAIAPGEEGVEAFEVALECSSHPDARAACLHAVREWGRIVYLGEGGSVSFEASPTLIHKQLALHGSWVCSIGQMEELVERLVRWKLHPEEIVTHRFSLEQAGEAYAAFDSANTGKVAITWGDA